MQLQFRYIEYGNNYPEGMVKVAFIDVYPLSDACVGYQVIDLKNLPEFRDFDYPNECLINIHRGSDPIFIRYWNRNRELSRGGGRYLIVVADSLNQVNECLDISGDDLIDIWKHGSMGEVEN